jgi:alkanesulfonate monooxygenase SsuD/methylene tetrahydromethanopterin reductase-like flavin-dependent oxidoreductase (luciferase family)
VRVDRLAESLEVLDALLAGRHLTFHGEHYSFDQYVNFPPPVQQPRPPILVAGAGRRVLSIAAQRADTVALLSAPLSGGVLVDSAAARSPRHLSEQVDTVRQAAGDRFANLELSLFATMIITADRRAAGKCLARRRRWEVSADEVLAMPTVLIGNVQQICEDLQLRRERHVISYFVLWDSELRNAAPIIQRLVNG